MARLSDPITVLKGIGPTKAKQFAVLGIHTLEDLICHFPRGYEDRTRLIMMYDGHIVVDVSGEEKKNLTVEQLLNLFSKASGSDEANDKLLLS